jgi:MAPEG family
MASTIIAKNLCIVVGLTYAESKFGPSTKNTCGPLGLSAYFGLTPLLLSLYSFWTVVHGFGIGMARSKYIEQAKKDGETEVEERYQLPNLYAQGTSKNVQGFNCEQRSHQHILETITQAMVTGLIGAIEYPISAAIITSSYIVGRIALSKGYQACKDGDASKRYSSPLAFLHWYGLISSMLLGMASGIKMIASSHGHCAKK